MTATKLTVETGYVTVTAPSLHFANLEPVNLAGLNDWLGKNFPNALIFPYPMSGDLWLYSRESFGEHEDIPEDMESRGYVPSEEWVVNYWEDKVN